MCGKCCPLSFVSQLFCPAFSRLLVCGGASVCARDPVCVCPRSCMCYHYVCVSAPLPPVLGPSCGSPTATVLPPEISFCKSCRNVKAIKHWAAPGRAANTSRVHSSLFAIIHAWHPRNVTPELCASHSQEIWPEYFIFEVIYLVVCFHFY